MQVDKIYLKIKLCQLQYIIHRVLTRSVVIIKVIRRVQIVSLIASLHLVSKLVSG
jgi:hypothetical protein